MEKLTQQQAALAPLLAILQAQSFGSDCTLGRPLQPGLLKRVVEIEEKLQSINVPAHWVFTIPYCENAQVYPGKKFDWVVMPSHLDPNYQHKAGFALPSAILKNLRRIYKAGVDFDTLMICHEIEKHGDRTLPITDSELLPPPPREGLERSAKLGTAGDTLQKMAVGAALLTMAGATVAAAHVALTTIAASVAGSALASASVVAPLAIVSTDPVLLGGVTERGALQSGQPVAYMLLGAWRYNNQ